MKCPVCATEMDQHARHGVTIDHCPGCGGVWLDKGELDHLMAAVRPAVTLRDPEPPRPAAPSRPVRAPAPSTSQRPASERAPRGARFDERARDEGKKPGRAQRYEKRYSKKNRLKDLIEEIFDFD